MPTWVTKKWVKILSATHPTLAFHASITNSFGKGALINLLRQVRAVAAAAASSCCCYGLERLPREWQVVQRVTCDVSLSLSRLLPYCASSGWRMVGRVVCVTFVLRLFAPSLQLPCACFPFVFCPPSVRQAAPGQEADQRRCGGLPQRGEEFHHQHAQEEEGERTLVVNMGETPFASRSENVLVCSWLEFGGSTLLM